MTATRQPNVLRLVHSAIECDAAPKWFCGNCAAEASSAPPPNARVCSSCGLGLMLETRSDGAPAESDAFLIVDATLAVQAVSERAEQLLGVTEQGIVDRHIQELLIPASAENRDPAGFSRAIIESATRSDEFTFAYVRPWNTYGVRMRARISACGPPRAALIVLESGYPPLEAV